jgi:TetR/AcrR family transcriptional regulator, lmrAB and yxaGH operons repressor
MHPAGIGRLCFGWLLGGLTPARASSLARTIISSLEGALILARSERDTTTITQVGNEIAEMIENAMRP